MLPVALALQAVAALNVLCTGTLRSGPLGVALPEETGEPFSITYRIDLANGLWCSDACAASEPIAEVVAGQILLRDRHHAAGSHVIIVTPRTGRFTDTLIEGDIATLRSGRCAFPGSPPRIAAAATGSDPRPIRS